MNKIKFGFMSLLIALGLASCNENDYKYTAADILQNEQVAFPLTVPTTVNLTAAEPSIDLALTRQKTEGDLTVNIVAEGELTNEDGTVTYITVPNSATFLDGEDKTSIRLTANLNEIGYDNVKKISLSIAEDEMTTPYGFSKLNLSVSFPAPWASLGLATFTDDAVGPLYSMEALTYEVEIQENQIERGLFRLVNPYGKNYPFSARGLFDPDKTTYIEINATDPDFVYIMPQTSGLTFNTDDGEIMFADMAGYYILNGYTPEAAKAKGLGGTYKDGEISFPTKGMVAGFDNFADGAYYANNSGLFSIVMPGVIKADYSINMAYTGVMTAADNSVSAVVDVTLGKDAKDVRAIVAPKSADAEAVADALAADELEYTEIKAGSNMIAFDPEELESSDLQVVAVVVVDGEAKKVANVKFTYYGGGQAPWKSLGIGLYSDDAIITLFNGFDEPEVYEVEFMESTETPGVYRVMNPYSPGVHPYGEALVNSGFTMPDADNSTYITIDAQVSDGILIPTSPLGVDLGDGIMELVSVAADAIESGDYTFEELYDMGACGKIEDGDIYFPTFTARSGTKYQGYVKEAGQLAYYAGMHSGIEFLLPEAYANDQARQNAAKYAMRVAKAKANALKLQLKKANNVPGYKQLPVEMIGNLVKRGVKVNKFAF